MADIMTKNVTEKIHNRNSDRISDGTLIDRTDVLHGDGHWEDVEEGQNRRRYWIKVYLVESVLDSDGNRVSGDDSGCSRVFGDNLKSWSRLIEI
jgi:hypothetical protein